MLDKITQQMVKACCKSVNSGAGRTAAENDTTERSATMVKVYCFSQ